MSTNYVYGSTASPSAEEINEMKKFMINDIEETPVSVLAEAYSKVPKNTTYDPMQPYEVDYNPVPVVNAFHDNTAKVTSRIAPQSKSINLYDVAMGGKQIVTGIWMAESAKAIANLLNEGCAINDERLFTILSSCVVYDKVFTKLKSKYTERARVLRECRYDDAKVIDSEVTKLKAEAEQMRQKTIAYMDKHNINYK